MNENQLSTNIHSSDTPSTRKKTMSPAAIAANRANAQRSTGPRTPNGKLKAASNSLKHGLYSLKNFDNFIADHDDALAVATNFIEQFSPVTPTEVALVHQLIHMQLRFLQMEYLYSEAMRFRVEDILTKPVAFLPAIMRELDRLPSRIQRTIKLLRAEIAQREAFLGHGENVKIEPIKDAPPLPGRPPSEVYYEPPTGTRQHNPATQPIHTTKDTSEDAATELAKQIVREFTDKLLAKQPVQNPAPASQAPIDPIG